MEETQIPKKCRAENTEKRKTYPLNELKLRGMVASLNKYPKKRLVHEESDNY